METILTPAQAKTARIKLGISQANIANLLNINRSYLSQFETGKYILPDKDLDTLRAHYETEGFDFADDEPLPAQESANKSIDADTGDHVRLMDGFAVPDYLAPDLVEDLLFEYEENIQKISQLCTYDIRANHTEKPWFDDPYIDNNAVQQFTGEALVLMARNFNIVEELRGHESCLPITKFSDANTAGDFIGLKFGSLTS